MGGEGAVIDMAFRDDEVCGRGDDCLGIMTFLEGVMIATGRDSTSTIDLESTKDEGGLELLSADEAGLGVVAGRPLENSESEADEDDRDGSVSKVSS